jgi:hypothetical protein
MENTIKNFQVREKRNGEFVAWTKEKGDRFGEWSKLIKEFETMKQAEAYAKELNNPDYE